MAKTPLLAYPKTSSERSWFWLEETQSTVSDLMLDPVGLGRQG